MSKEEAYRQGVQARRDGLRSDAQPYDLRYRRGLDDLAAHTRSAEMAQAWLAGWQDAAYEEVRNDPSVDGTGKCRTCRHAKAEWNDEIDKSTGDREVRMARCKAICGEEDSVGDKSNLPYIYSQGCIDLAIYVPLDFGCVLHEPIDRKPD